MSFDYDKLRDKHEEVNWWASYCDLWTMLSVVFLIMFVCTSLRTGSQGIQQQLEYQGLQQKNAELEEQIRVYSNLRDETLSDAGEREQEVYKKLMSKLSLLQEEAKDEKNNLRKQAKENEEKEFALNEYQQVVRNIIDSNILSKARIDKRDKIIVEKKQTIAEKQQEIRELDQQVRKREAVIATNQQKIKQIDNQLAAQITKLEAEQKKAKLTKQAMYQQVNRLKQESEKKIATIAAENEETRQALEGELQQTKNNYSTQLSELRAENAAKLAGERKAFEEGLAKQRLGAAAKAAKLAAYGREAEARAQQLEGELGGLAGKVKDAEGQLAAARDAQGKLLEEARGLAREKDALGNQLGNLSGKVKAAEGQLAVARATQGQLEEKARTLAQEKQALGSELQGAQDRLNARKNLVAQIKKNFAKAGIKAAVDEKTGDVVIDFGQEYFDTGSSELKGGMLAALSKMIPTYSRSLFEDPKTAEKLANIEIIGFASSTFKGRYVNPKSLKSANQEAINYNLKLSFSRANAIFKHIFNPAKMSFEHQKQLLGMVKVVGRGFLPDGLNANDLPEDMPEKEFCAKYNCKKSQKVIVKFNLKE